MATTRWTLNNTTGGLWTSATNWSAGVPNAQGDFVTFDITDPALSSGGAGTRAIDLGGGSKTMGFLNLAADSTRAWNITNGTVVMLPNGGNAFLEFDNLGNTSLVAQSAVTANLLLKAGLDVFVGQNENSQLFLGDINEFSAGKGLNKFGEGVLILTGTSSYSGQTVINAGILQVGTGGTTGTLGSGAVVNNAILSLGRSDITTVANQISGSGVVHATVGTLTLTAANTYTGGTIIHDGTLAYGHANALGTSGTITIEAPGTLDLNGFVAAGAGDGSLFARIDDFSAGTIRNTGAQLELVSTETGQNAFGASLQGNMDLTMNGLGTTYLSGNSSLNETGIVGWGLLKIAGGTVALTGMGEIYSILALDSGGTFDIGGVADGTARVNDLKVSAGTINLGGNELIVDDAELATELGAPTGVLTLRGLAGEVDSMVIMGALGLAAGDTFDVNLSNGGLLFQGWEDGFDTFTIKGANQSDSITGTIWSDAIFGSRDGLATDRDSLDGGSGDDTLSGGAGNDLLTGGYGDDALNGGANTDTADYSGAPAGINGVGVRVSLTLNGVAQNTRLMGVDTLTDIENLSGSKNDDRLTGNAGVNVILGNSGDDTIEGGAGADNLNGGLGFDTLSYAGSAAGVNINITTRVVSGGDAAGDVIAAGFENITGSGLNDTLTGNGAANVILGGAGGDNITASKGDDTVNGGAGSDIIRGGVGTDLVTGGNGNDTFVFVNNATTEWGDTITDFHNAVGDNDVIRFSGFGVNGPLPPELFISNTTGITDGVATLIYNTATGDLFGDLDLNPATAALLLAHFVGIPTLTAADFVSGI